MSTFMFQTNEIYIQQIFLNGIAEFSCVESYENQLIGSTLGKPIIVYSSYSQPMMHGCFKVGNVSCCIVSDTLFFIFKIRVLAISKACPYCIHALSGHKFVSLPYPRHVPTVSMPNLGIIAHNPHTQIGTHPNLFI